MKQAFVRASLAALVVAVAAPQMFAAPAPSPSAVAPTTSTLLSSHFAGATLTTTTVKSLLTTAGEKRALVDWNRCVSLADDGTDVAIDHCVALTFGTASDLETLILSDQPCPTGAPSNVCYANYLLHIVGHGSVHADGDSTVIADSEVRLIQKRFVPGVMGVSSPSWKYSRPTLPSLAFERRGTLGKGGLAWDSITIRNGKGAVVAVADSSMAVSLPSTLSCTDIGDLVRSGMKIGANMAGLVVLLGGGALSLDAGGIITLGGTAGTAGVGAPAAAAGGGSVAAAGIALSVGLALGVRELGYQEAELAATIARELCEMMQKVEDFKPEPFNGEPETAQEETSGAKNPFSWMNYADDDNGEECENEGEWTCQGTSEVDGKIYEVWCANLRNESGGCDVTCVGIPQ